MLDNKKQREWKNKTKKQAEKLDLLWRIRKEIKWWKKDLKKTLGYYPDSEWIVQLICSTKEERNEILKEKKFLTWENCHFQIWKVQKDDWTIYSDLMLSIWIEYLINHTKEWEKSIIQVFSEVWELLLQWKEEWVYSPQQEKEHIEDMIREKFWRKWKCIEVKIWSEQWKNTEVFDALRSKEKWKRRFWIIPKDEPDIDEYLATTKKEDLSPLPMIQYLAYHANKDETLMKLFYDTKPPAYKNDDELIENYKPWCADADYYWLVEVWLRLTEVLKWVSIQWWVWRQRVYDKIISLILNWEDTIQRNDLFDCGAKEKINKYPALEKLHKIISNRSKEAWLNTDFKQLYIELNRPKLDEVEKKVKTWERIINELRYGALIFATLSMYMLSDVKDKDLQERAIKENQVWLDIAEKNRIADTYPYNDSVRNYYEAHKNDWYIVNAPNKEWRYESEQRKKLESEYDLSKFDKKYSNGNNEIVELYSIMFRWNFRTNKKYLSAEDFMKNYPEILGEHYLIEYKKPYEHLRPYKKYIENTLKYWDKIDISKYKVKEIKIKDTETWNEKIFSYYDEEERHTYIIKFIKLTEKDRSKLNRFKLNKLLKKDRKPPIKIVIVEDWYYWGKELSMEEWQKVLQKLVDKYWENFILNQQSRAE